MRITLTFALLLRAVTFAFASAAATPPRDAVLFDFEQGHLDGWTVHGQNPLVNGKPLGKKDMNGWKRGPVGFRGDYYLETGGNEGRHDSHPDGTLQSPAFTLSKAYLNFYLAGELNPHVRVYLLVDGRVVREAFGNNFYDLQLRGWDVSEWKGRKARFCLQDSSALRSLIRVDHVFLSNTPPPAPEQWVTIPKRQESPLVALGEFKLILPNPRLDGGSWTIKHSCVVKGHDGKWHLYASGYAQPDEWKSDGVKYTRILHATSPTLSGGDWQWDGEVMRVSEPHGEDFLKEPYVVFHQGQYYLYYVGAGNPWSGWYVPPGGRHNRWYGGKSGDQGPYQIFLATSRDGRTWERAGEEKEGKKGPVFTDKPFAFTPFVTRIDDQWVMYYASAEEERADARHGIGYRTSPDLVHWSDRKLALRDWAAGDPHAPADTAVMKPASPWPEHTFYQFPLVFNRGKTWYLLAGPVDNGNLSRYHVLRIYRSADPFRFDNHREALEVNKRLFVDGGAKVLRDTDGKWYITTGNEMAGGVWLAPLHWNDGLDDQPTSVPVAGR